MVYATTHNLPIIMTFYVQKRMPFWYTNFQNSPYRGKEGGGLYPTYTLPRSVALLPRFAPCSKILATPLALMELRRHNKKKGGGEKTRETVGDATTYNLTLKIMTFNVQKNAILIHTISKHLSTVHTLSLLGLFAPSLWPPLKNPAYTTVISVVKEGTMGHAPPPPSLIGE